MSQEKVCKEYIFGLSWFDNIEWATVLDRMREIECDNLEM